MAFSQHALAQLARRRIAAAELADLLLTRHDQRTRNPRSADWLLRAGGIVAAYNWPDGDDETTA